MSEKKTQENHIDDIGDSAGRLAAKARPKQISLPMSSSPTVKIPVNEREWIDVEPGECDPRSFETSKIMTRLLRHKMFLSLEKKTEQLNSKFWRFFTALVNSNMADVFAKEEVVQRRDSRIAWIPFHSDTPLYLRAIQGHSGGSQIDPALQGNVLLPNDFADYIYHVGSSHDLHTIIQSGLIPGGKDIKKGRHAVFFMAVNPMLDDNTRSRITT